MNPLVLQNIELVVILPTGDQLLRLRGTDRAWWWIAPRRKAQAAAPPPPDLTNVTTFPKRKEQ